MNEDIKNIERSFDTIGSFNIEGSMDMTNGVIYSFSRLNSIHVDDNNYSLVEALIRNNTVERATYVVPYDHKKKGLNLSLISTKKYDIVYAI